MIDFERYLRAVQLAPEPTHSGFLHFDCPFCPDTRGRGWVFPERWSAGCFNDGCEMHPKARSVFAWVAAKEGMRTAGQAREFLLAFYPGQTHVGGVRSEVTEDWCTLPGTPSLASLAAQRALRFARRQWGITEAEWVAFGLRVCTRGPFAGRLILPVTWRGRVVTFTSRHLFGGEPRYRAAEGGVDSARDVGELCFNLDAVTPGARVLLVEGPGDVLGCVARALPYVPVALFGTELNGPRAARLLAQSPAHVTVALDATALATSDAVARTLAAWDVPVAVATWAGAKDAGAGAALRVLHEGPSTLAHRLARLRA